MHCVIKMFACVSGVDYCIVPILDRAKRREHVWIEILTEGE